MTSVSRRCSAQKFANYTGAALGVYFYVFGLLVWSAPCAARARGFDVALGVMALLGAFALRTLITGAFMLAAACAIVGAVVLAALLDGRLAQGLSPARLVAWLRTASAPRAIGAVGDARRSCCSASRCCTSWRTRPASSLSRRTSMG
ncbi:MAG: hypothetical protein U1E86_28700 [Burkholderiaceae bacterium]